MRRPVSLLHKAAQTLSLGATALALVSAVPAFAAPPVPAAAPAAKVEAKHDAKPDAKAKAPRAKKHAAKKHVRGHRKGDAKVVAKHEAAHAKAVAPAPAKHDAVKVEASTRTAAKPAAAHDEKAASAEPVVAAKEAPAKRPGPSAVAIVDATPLRFAPRTDADDAKPEAAKVEPGKGEAKGEPTKADAKAEPVKGEAKPEVAAKEGKGAKKGKKGKKEAPKPPCLREAVHFERFEEKSSFSLLTCEGAPAPFAIERLSIMARPGGMPVPSEAIDVLAKRKGDVVAPGVKRLDAGLLERIQAVVEKLRPKAAANVSVISGYRPASKGSLHAEGQAIDFSLAGSTNTELVDACKTLDDTGCGFYPNSSFIHLDVRPKGAGHVSWIDASGPGEEARYVSGWPLSPNDARRAKAAAQGIDLQERQGREWHQIPTDERRGVAASTAAPIAMPDEPSDR
jgi:hypothetical protein